VVVKLLHSGLQIRNQLVLSFTLIPHIIHPVHPLSLVITSPPADNNFSELDETVGDAMMGISEIHDWAGDS
jgi:hypothetical protein